MAIKKGAGHSRAERRQPPPDSLGGREPASEDKMSKDKTPNAALIALAARQRAGQASTSTFASASSSSKKHKRGHANKAQARAKLERAVDNAERLHMKAAKRAKRDEKRKRAKE